MGVQRNARLGESSQKLAVRKTTDENDSNLRIIRSIGHSARLVVASDGPNDRNGPGASTPWGTCRLSIKRDGCAYTQTARTQSCELAF